MTKPCVSVCPYCRRRGRKYSPSGGTSLHTVTNGGSSAGPRREGQCTPPPKAPPRHLGPGRRWPTALQHRPPDDGANAPTAPTATHPGSNPRAQRHSEVVDCLYGRPRPFASEPGPRGRTKPRPATPAPKPRLTSPSAFQQNTGTRKMTRERNISCTQPSRQPSAGGATDAQTPTPPAACDRNALSAL